MKACINCEDDEYGKADVRMPCKVCELKHNDLTVKRVKWCKLCKAYICEEHRNDTIDRIQAALLNVVSNVTAAVTNKGSRRSSKNKQETQPVNENPATTDETKNTV